jgi:hypothetical protein
MALYHGCYNPPRYVRPKAPFDEGCTQTTRVVVATRKKQKIEKGHYSADNWHLYLTKAVSRDDREDNSSRLPWVWVPRVLVQRTSVISRSVSTTFKRGAGNTFLRVADTRYGYTVARNDTTVWTESRKGSRNQKTLLFMSTATLKPTRLECYLPRLSGVNKVSLFRADSLARCLLQCA